MKFYNMLKKYKIYFVLVICLLAISFSVAVYADKISDIQDDIADIKSQQSEATRKMQEAEDNIAKYQNEISSLEGDIAEYTKDIDSLNGIYLILLLHLGYHSSNSLPVKHYSC